jgi:guanylate kinase
MKGILFILSAPSGAGKTTISRKAVAEIPGLEMSVSATTRAARAGEKPGVDYHFLTKEEFERRRDADEFAEWARVHDHFYGTPRAPIESALANGRDMLLDIDVQGARQMRERYPESVAVFVLPPSVEELERRLRGRGTDPDEVIRRRLDRAKEEMKEAPAYDHRIVNEEIAKSVGEFASIVAAERARVRRA